MMIGGPGIRVTMVMVMPPAPLRGLGKAKAVHDNPAALSFLKPWFAIGGKNGSEIGHDAGGELGAGIEHRGDEHVTCHAA